MAIVHAALARAAVVVAVAWNEPAPELVVASAVFALFPHVARLRAAPAAALAKASVAGDCRDAGRRVLALDNESFLVRRGGFRDACDPSIQGARGVRRLGALAGVPTEEARYQIDGVRRFPFRELGGRERDAWLRGVPPLQVGGVPAP